MSLYVARQTVGQEPFSLASLDESHSSRAKHVSALALARSPLNNPRFRGFPAE